MLAEASAWNTMVWFGALISLAGTLKPVMTVLSEALGSVLRSMGMGWYMNLVLVIVFYFVTHYGFASTTAHVLAMYVPLVDALISYIFHFKVKIQIQTKPKNVHPPYIIFVIFIFCHKISVRSAHRRSPLFQLPSHLH